MAQDIIEFLVSPKLDVKGIDNQSKAVGELMDKNIGKPLDESLSKYFKKINGELVTFAKMGGKYRRLSVGLDKKGNVTGWKLGDSYTKKGATQAFTQELRQEEVREKEIQAINKKKKEEQAKARKKANEEQKKRERAREVADIIGSTLTGDELTKFQLSTAKNNLSDLEKQFSTVRKGTKKYEELKNKIIETQNEVNKLSSDLQKSLDEKKMSGWDKFLRRFKSYFTIRIFRNFFSAVEKGFSESLTNIAKFDSGVNDTMSTITSSFTILSNSLASVVVPLLELVEPALTRITEVVAKMAEGISYLIAKLTGSATYLKANTKYTKDFSNAMSQLSFVEYLKACDLHKPFLL